MEDLFRQLKSHTRQAKNIGKLFASRAVSLGTKYLYRGSAAFSTPRVPLNTPTRPPTTYENAKNTLKAFFMGPTLLLDTPNFCIYVGSAFNTAKESTYRQQNVTHVLNCAGSDDYVPMFYADHIQVYQQIPMRDESTEAIDFITDPRIQTDLYNFFRNVNTQRDPTNKATVLIHCIFGRSRSVAICCIILFLYFQKHPKHPPVENSDDSDPPTMTSCYYYIGERRKVIAINRQLFTQLTRFEEHFLHDKDFHQKWSDLF